MVYTEKGRLAWLEKPTTTRKGPWGYSSRPSGGYTFWKQGMNPGGLTTTGENELREKALKELELDGKYSSATNWQISAYGILDSGKISIKGGRKYLDLPEGRQFITPQQVSEAIKTFWMPRWNRDRGCYVPTNKGSLTDFGELHPRIYKHLSRKENGGGFRANLDQMYCGLYDQISQRNSPDTIKLRLNNLRKELISRFNKGMGISPNWLKSSSLKNERELGYAIEEFREGLFRIKKNKKVTQNRESPKKSPILGETPSEAAARITGLPSSEFSLSMGANKRLSVITEGLTSLMFNWSHIVDFQPFGFNLIQEPPHLKSTLFLQEEKEYFADFRIGNTPIEVKNVLTSFNNGGITEINNKYCPEKSRWKDGDNLRDLVLVFHAPKPSYASYLEKLDVPIRTIIHYNDFHSELKELVTKMNKSNGAYKDVRPSCNLEDLVKLHEEASLHPFLLIRDGDIQRLNWYREVIRRMVVQARQIINIKDLGDQDEFF